MAHEIECEHVRLLSKSEYFLEKKTREISCIILVIDAMKKETKYLYTSFCLANNKRPFTWERCREVVSIRKEFLCTPMKLNNN